MEYLSCPQSIAIPQMIFSILGTGFFVPSGGCRKITFKSIGGQTTETTGCGTQTWCQETMSSFVSRLRKRAWLGCRASGSGSESAMARSTTGRMDLLNHHEANVFFHSGNMNRTLDSLQHSTHVDQTLPFTSPFIGDQWSHSLGLFFCLFKSLETGSTYVDILLVVWCSHLT